MRFIEKRKIVYTGTYKCGRCRTKFAIDENDQVLKEPFRRRAWDDYTSAPYVQCPSCSFAVDVQAKSVLDTEGGDDNKD